jgi:hypothetical protein
MAVEGTWLVLHLRNTIGTTVSKVRSENCLACYAAIFDSLVGVLDLTSTKLLVCHSFTRAARSLFPHCLLFPPCLTQEMADLLRLCLAKEFCTKQKLTCSDPQSHMNGRGNPPT